MTELTRSRERQKADRKEHILGVALALMSERGFTATTYELIAKRAGVSRGTVFNYFPYKESILLAFAAAELVELRHRVEERRQLGPAWGATEELKFVFQELALFASQRRALVMPLSYELLSPNPERSRAAYRSLPLADLLREALQRGQVEGSVRRDHTAERLARTLANTYFITALQWAAYRSDRSLKSELATALKLTLEGVQPAVGELQGTTAGHP